MKKYLMTTIAVVTMGAAFTSCSHNFDVYNSEDEKVEKEKYSAELVQAEYEAVFEQTFGKPAADQDWGFGDDNASTRALTRATTFGNQNIEPIFHFPTAPGQSEFPTERDRNAELLTGYKDSKNLIYYIDETINGNGQTIQPNVSWDAEKKDLVLYVEGDVKPTDIYTPVKTTIYILPNSKLTIPASRSSFGQNYTHIYIGTGAELIIQGNQVEFGSGVKVYNKGTITAQNIVVSNDGLLYNMGTISTNELSVKNTSSVIVNDNTITANFLNTAGGGKIQNNYNMTINGETCINSNNNTWVNNGHYKTETFVYTAGSADVINNCFLEVTGDFNINLGDTQTNGFRIDAGGGVKTKNFNGGGPFSAKKSDGGTESFQGGPYKIVMGSGSVFKVTNEAHLNALGSGTSTSPYGFIAVGDYAVFEANKVLKEGKGHGNVVYSGNLYVSAEQHFAQETEGYADGSSAILFANGCSVNNIYAPGFASGKPNITIEKTECNPGFEGNETITDLRIICEDLSATSGTDYDFNDVVFDVFFGDAGEAYIEVLAAGGTLPLYINDVEVHCLLMNTGDIESLRNEKGILPMINTNATSRGLYGFEGVPAKTIQLDNAIKTRRDCGLSENIKIEVEKNGERCEITAKKGQAAAKIAVQRDFFGSNQRWLDERVDIKSINNNAFTKFVKGEMKWNQWYK